MVSLPNKLFHIGEDTNDYYKYTRRVAEMMCRLMMHLDFRESAEELSRQGIEVSHTTWYQIGSGVIESACPQAAMRWQEKGVNPVLSARFIDYRLNMLKLIPINWQKNTQNLFYSIYYKKHLQTR